MSAASKNWLKFGGLATVAFTLGLLIAGLLNLPAGSWALQRPSAGSSIITPVRALPSTPALKSLEELSEAFSSVAEAVRPSVVFVSAQHTEKAQPNRTLPPGIQQFFPQMPQRPQVERGTGSGFIVSADGYILTNNHVVAGADKVTVRLIDQRQFTARVVGTDPATDVALLKIPAHDLTPLALGNSDATHVGEWVLAIGNPLGDNLAFTVTQGIISAKGRRLDGLNQGGQRSISDFIQTDAAINPGNSGGPLVNVRGEVIGINSAIASETGYYSGYGFAIPINLVREVMDQLVAHGKVERAQLGVLVNQASANDAAYVGLDRIRGVLVQDFGDDSPAKQAGIQRGDVVISIDGKPVDRVAELQQAVAFKRPGEEVKVEVARRGGVRKTFTVRLTAATDSDTAKLAQGGDRQDQGEPSAQNAGKLLGVEVRTLTADLANQYQLPDDVQQGAVVTSVDPNGPSAGFLADQESGGPDIITAVEGKAIKNAGELRSALKGAGSGAIVTLDVYNAQGDARRLVRVKLDGGGTGS